ncbi:MAG: hypothetical protein J6Q89_03865 [Clostridia bacterium]|nr:hypothetical protein [Clostridia bacterium]
MNFETTSILLDAIKPYIENATLEITGENKDWRNRNYKSDFVTIDAKNHVGFEVLDNEVIAFYFTDHYHFEDYSSELQDGENNYVERAKSFLRDLFECKIRHVEYYKGKTLSSEKYFVMYHDGREDECIGYTWFGFSKFINPFGKKTMRSTTWQFDKSKGVFTTRQPKSVDSNAIEIIDISDDCYIEIFCNHNVYTYDIMEIDFDDYFGMYYWAPAVNVLPTGMYDTKEKAIAAARETLECRATPQ